jgi:hypothetical protein
MEQLDCVSQPAKKEPTQMDVGRKHPSEGERSRDYLPGPRTPGIRRLAMSITPQASGCFLLKERF